MKDPYETLGVTRTATDAEIKTAYRELAKKYHPDNYTDSPLSDLADEKMKEINQAYDLIMDQRRSGESFKQGSSNSSFSDVRNLIRANRMADAEQILSGVPMSSRNAEWYFLRGTVFYRKGWMDQAYDNMQKACAMDPGNSEYSSAFSHMNNQRGGSWGGYNKSGSSSNGCSSCDVCCGLLCADSCCECMGGDLIPCC